MKLIPVVRQIRPNACTIAVIRAILKVFEHRCYSEDQMIKDFSYLIQHGCTPSNLSVQFWNDRGYCAETADNQTVSDIVKKTEDINTYAMVILEPPVGPYHCVLFGEVSDSIVYYMDPAEQNTGLTGKSIFEFEELRRIKGYHPSCTVREVIYVWEKAKSRNSKEVRVKTFPLGVAGPQHRLTAPCRTEDRPKLPQHRR